MGYSDVSPGTTPSPCTALLSYTARKNESIIIAGHEVRKLKLKLWLESFHLLKPVIVIRLVVLA